MVVASPSAAFPEPDLEALGALAVPEVPEAPCHCHWDPATAFAEALSVVAPSFGGSSDR